MVEILSVLAVTAFFTAGIAIYNKVQAEKKRNKAGIYYNPEVEDEKERKKKEERKKLKPDNPNLIFCPDCHKEVSKNAKACIHCGCDLTLGHTKTNQSINKTARGMRKVGCTMIIVQALIFWLVLLFIIFYALV
jgi:hypothetical protein